MRDHTSLFSDFSKAVSEMWSEPEISRLYPLEHSGNYTSPALILNDSAFCKQKAFFYDSHNKQRLFPQTALTGWLL
jgi:hypothetical protein